MSGVAWFVVDYDVPAEPKAKHMAFYRALWKVLRELEVETSKRSTQSVWVTDNQGIAERIHELGKLFGQSHLYRAEEVD